MRPVADQALLDQLDGAPSGLKPVKDEQLLRELDRHDPAGTTFENIAAGAGKAVADAGRGVRQILSNVPGLNRFDTFNPEKVQEEVDDSRKYDAALMNTTAGKVGNLGGNVAMAAPTIFVPGANTYTGATTMSALMGLVQPTVEGESRTMNTIIAGGAGAAGKFVGDKVAAGVTSRLARKTGEAAQAQAANAGRDATLTAAREVGYVAPPAQTNPSSAWNQLLEGVSGKVKTAQAASVKNQAVTNRLARDAVGLEPDTQITREGLKAIRDKAGEAYEAIANFGRYEVDDVFRARLGDISKAQQVLAKEVPELADDEVLALVRSLDRTDFDGRTMIEMTKALREKATTAFKAGETGAGRFYRGAADEVEDLIERNLLAADTSQFAVSKAAGSTYQAPQDLMAAFREARQTIAKAHTIEAALNDATGNVVAGKLAAQLAKGKPLSGGLETAGRFANAFPKAAQNVDSMGSNLAVGPLDYATGMITSAAMGDLTGLAGVAARPTIRSILMSKPYQSAMTAPSYGPGVGTRTLSELLGNEYTRQLAPRAASATALQYRQ